MYASSMGELDAAVEQLQSMPNKEYVQRIEKFLQRKAEWVLLFHSKLMTRGHNTNNFAEASICILKDAVLHRQKAYNAVALVDLVVEVWEAYFKFRLLDHAYGRVPAHELLYHKLLDKMPQLKASSLSEAIDMRCLVRSWVEARSMKCARTLEPAQLASMVPFANTRHWSTMHMEGTF
ncbi:hypothetical protein HPB50_013737 [Hyalomma asiaticum]|uniref:Uncharacterized protein n=1 Tax=Hyalomma asiaticum TaxID=266040 RepID=A0ACB7SHK5_HYAAI|nr:hypothetical protein HPB50_013737 [Hyalomma asiaticum]